MLDGVLSEDLEEVELELLLELVLEDSELSDSLRLLELLDSEENETLEVLNSSAVDELDSELELELVLLEAVEGVLAEDSVLRLVSEDGVLLVETVLLLVTDDKLGEELVLEILDSVELVELENELLVLELVLSEEPVELVLELEVLELLVLELNEELVLFSI